MASHILATADRAIEVADRHAGHLVARFEAEVGFKPIKVALWGVAVASVLGAAAAGLGAVAAGAGACVAVRAAKRARNERATEHGAGNAAGNIAGREAVLGTANQPADEVPHDPASAI